jgi:hypothetical protein
MSRKLTSTSAHAVRCPRDLDQPQGALMNDLIDAVRARPADQPEEPS